MTSSSPDTPFQPPEGLWHLDQYRLLLCSTCKTAIRPARGGEMHLRTVHRWTGERLKQAVAYMMTLSLQNPHTVDIPSNSSAVISQLALLAGYQCPGCGYLTVNRENMLKHGKTTGHFRHGQGWWKVRLQTFSQRRYARY